MKKSFFDYRQNINFEQFIKTQIHVFCRWCFITVNTVIIKSYDFLWQHCRMTIQNRKCRKNGHVHWFKPHLQTKKKTNTRPHATHVCFGRFTSLFDVNCAVCSAYHSNVRRSEKSSLSLDLLDKIFHQSFTKEHKILQSYLIHQPM